MRTLLVVALILLPAYAVGAQAPDDGGKSEGSPKKICRVDPNDTESRIRRRVCKTQDEWNRKSDDEKPATDRDSKQGQ